jgi:hypothetical protein
MARGWESKAIETQQEEAARGRRAPSRVPTPEERERHQRRQTLELARKKAEADLRMARTPAHRAVLERALEDLARQLAAL